ncbi:MAG TPA: hypothetical protein VFP32_00740 [Candidatus Saccharimonadales bacterium]|nr:hypothetical protein [Candidatus Saccharimonadales bacterium]
MYENLASLNLQIESFELLPLSQRVPGFTRKTTVIKLNGNGFEGVGEDVTYDPKAQTAFQRDGQKLEMAGSYSLQNFGDKIASMNLFRAEPTMPAFRQYRQWAFESAALSLALKQAGTNLPELLGRKLKPLNFVVSKDLRQAKDVTQLEKIKRAYPTLRFKVDVSNDWSSEIIERLIKLDAIDVLDFKAYYKGSRAERKINPELYKKLAEVFPKAFIEDPAIDTKTRPILEKYKERITWDAPLHSLNDLLSMPFVPKVTNIKPSRFGSLKELFNVYDYCLQNGVGMYGGGQFELGHGRHHIQYLASLFHSDSSNDVAPGGFNETVLKPGLPTPPLKIDTTF